MKNIDMPMQRLYLLYLVGLFCFPLLFIVIWLATHQRKQSSDWWKLNHCEYLIKESWFGLIWIVITIAFMWLLSLAGLVGFEIGFYLGVVSLVILWGYGCWVYFYFLARAVRASLVESTSRFLIKRFFSIFSSRLGFVANAKF